MIKAHDRIWKLPHIPFRRREAACRALEETLRAMIVVSGHGASTRPSKATPILEAVLQVDEADSSAAAPRLCV
jgi:hypothetical protein